jgi:hypothetical protein
MSTSAVTAKAGTMTQRPLHANIYKPAGVKPVQTAIPWIDGGQTTVSAKFDLTLPVRGVRLKFSGRLVIGTAPFTSVNPEGLLNLISDITIHGTNSRQNGDVTLWDIDLATLYGISHLFSHRAAQFQINGVQVGIPGTPWPTGYLNGATGTYDFVITVDLPFHPFKCPAATRPGFLVRQEEWSDTVAISFKFGSQPNGVTGCLGAAAATTTVTMSGYGTGGGTPTVDVYSLPVQMGNLKNSVIPGFIQRVVRPVAAEMQAAGNNVSLLQLQKQRTSRIYLKTGTSTVAPAFATLSDTNLTAIGLVTGGSSRAVKPLVDIATYKHNQPADYERESIQGYTCFDFVESGNPDSSFPAQQSNVVGAGSTFELVGNVVGVANGLLLAIQEQVSYLHGGALYTF